MEHGHYIMMNTTLTQAEGDDFTTGNDFRRVGLVADPTNFGTTTVSSASTMRQTYALKLTSVSGTFDADEKISQTSTGAGIYTTAAQNDIWQFNTTAGTTGTGYVSAKFDGWGSYRILMVDWCYHSNDQC